MTTPDTLQEVPILTLRQQIFNDVALATGNFLDIDYSAREVLGKTLVEVIAGKTPYIKEILYGFGSLVNVLQTADSYIPNAPLFGDSNAAPFGTTEADLNQPTRSIPLLNTTQLSDLMTSNDQRRRLARIAHNVQKLTSHVQHVRKVTQRAKSTGIPISTATMLRVFKPVVTPVPVVTSNLMNLAMQRVKF